jgi:hypothetical protein
LVIVTAFFNFSDGIKFGFSEADGSSKYCTSIGYHPNSYAIGCYGSVDDCQIAGKRHLFEWPPEAIRPKSKAKGNVYGCGLLLDQYDKLAVFFTLNGTLIGKFL